VKKIVRELYVSRNTVRKFLRTGETDFSYERERQPMPRIGPWQRGRQYPCRLRRPLTFGPVPAQDSREPSQDTTQQMFASPPRNVLDLISRPEVRARMETGLDGQIVLLEAPAGFAKTETMATCFRSAVNRGRLAVWVELQPNTGPETVAGLLARALDLTDPEAAAVLEAIAARTAPVEVYIDAVDDMPRAEPLQWLFAHPPDSLRIVLAGRHLPDLRLSRLRQRGLVARLGPAELRFTRAETIRILRHRLGPDELETALTTLAGWPALVRLAWLELEAGVTGAARQALITGNARVFEEFIREDVFPGFDEGDRRVLRAVAGLDSFTPHIVAELSDTASDGEVMRRLDRLFPLILPEEQKMGWFRLSPVAEAFLRQDQSHESAEVRRARHSRAAALFAEQGSLEKSVLHASLAGDQALIVGTIESAGGVNLFLRLGYPVLRAILQAVPHEVVIATPSLRLCRSVMLAKSGRIAEARGAIDRLITERAFGEDDSAWAEALRHIDSLVSVYEDRGLDQAGIAELDEIAQGEPQENTWKLGWIHNHLTIAHTHCETLETAVQHAERALASYQEERASYPQAFILIHLAYIQGRMGRPDRALDLSARAQGLIRSRHWSDRNLQAIASVPLARARYLQGALPEARSLMEQAIPIMARGEGWVDFYHDAFATLARSVFAAEGWVAAREVLDDGQALADQRGLARLRLALSLLRVELLTRDGQLDAALALCRQWPETLDMARWPTPRLWREARLIQARLLLRGGNSTAALADLTALCDEAREVRAAAVLQPAALLRAEAASRLDQRDTAFAALEEAAELARPGGQIRPYHDEGKDFAAEIRRLLRRSGIGLLSRIAADYLSAAAPQPRRHGQSSPLVSARESQILTLLAEGLSSKAIARQIGVTEPTVKFHLKNLYAKLGVGRRHLAIAAARSLGLVPTDRG